MKSLQYWQHAPFHERRIGEERKKREGTEYEWENIGVKKWREGKMGDQRNSQFHGHDTFDKISRLP